MVSRPDTLHRAKVSAALRQRRSLRARQDTAPFHPAGLSRRSRFWSGAAVMSRLAVHPIVLFIIVDNASVAVCKDISQAKLLL